jgi:hypothetical protein
MYTTFLPEMADYVIEKELNANRAVAKLEKR